MLLGTFISRRQQIRTEPDAPSFLGHAPACFAHNKLSLSGNIFFSFLAFSVTAFSKQRDSSDDPKLFFVFAWEQCQLFVGLLLLGFCSFLAGDRLNGYWYLWCSIYWCRRICYQVTVGNRRTGNCVWEYQIKPKVRGTVVPTVPLREHDSSLQGFPGCCTCLSFPKSQCTVLRWCPKTRSLVIFAPS